jgi:hypothetical protein
MKLIVFSVLLAVALMLSESAGAAIYFAATNGTAGGTGSIASPWDLRTALAKTATLVGGDKLELRGGAFTNSPEHYVAGGNEGDIFQALISGAYANEIIVESATNEWAIIDGQAFGAPFEYHATARPTLMLGSSSDATKGRFLHLRNFEITSSSTADRFSSTVSCPTCIPPTDPSFPTDFFLSDGLYNFGQSNIIENLVVHDVSTGISAWQQSSRLFARNNVVYNNGWVGVTQLHGHGFYTQNTAARESKDISYNVVLNNYDNSIQAYGSGSASVYHYLIHHNILVNNRLLVGGRKDGDEGDNHVWNNLQFNSDLVFIYFTSINATSIEVTNNYIGLGGLQGGSWTNALIVDNTVIDSPTAKLFDYIPISGTTIVPGWTVDRNHYFFTPTNAQGFRVEGLAPVSLANWIAGTPFDDNSTINLLPTTNHVVLQPNQYDTNRAQIAAYNWSLGSTIAVNLATLGWSTLDSVRVRNAQDYLVDITTNTLPGNVITLNMLAASHTVALPHGSSTVTGPKTFPKFGAFVLERITGAASTPTNVITVTSSPANGFSIIATSDIDGNSTGTTSFIRNYLFGTPVTLAAPLTAGTNNFSKWRRAGVDFAFTNTVSFTVTTNETWQATYIAPPIVTWTLSFASVNPASGVTIGYSPNDNGGLGAGVTSFNRTNNDGVSITVTAPTTAGGNNFQKWSKNGVDFTTSVAFTIIANSANLVVSPASFVATYVAPAPVNHDLVVGSINPATGVPISLSVIDVNSLSNGITGFTRTYPASTSVQLSAPPTLTNGQVFVDWKNLDGSSASSGNSNVTVILSADASRFAAFTNAPLTSLTNVHGAKSRRRGTRL